jgi:predicted translin family RNA/ssDNA-binding protein
LQGVNAYRYSATITHGNQEFMEAISFRHYLEDQTLISPEESQANLNDMCPADQQVKLSEDDYLLGIYDMTGELMKLAITTMATSHSITTGHGGDDNMVQRNKVLSDLRDLRIQLESLNIPGSLNIGRDASKKMEVMKNSVEKVEKIFYGLSVRGAERPKGWVPDVRATMELEEVRSH